MQNTRQLVGRYVIADPIGSGGMATVHLGRLLGAGGFSRTVAIKRLHPELVDSSQVVSTLLDEARLASRIRHPNVVSALDFFEEKGELFLVMDYVVGESLGALLTACRSRGEHVPPAIAAQIVAGALHGLHAAHEATNEEGAPLRLVHRDVSPQNILVGVDGLARVLDFGIAKARGRVQTTRDGQVKGKLRYMAPEQIHGSDVTAASDVFSAGVVLWEALAGRRLFDGDNDGALVMAVVNQPIAPPSTFAPAVTNAVDAVVLQALERDPEARFPTARAFAEALEGAVAVASTADVGAWVKSTAKASLDGRAARVAALEAGGSSRDAESKSDTPQNDPTAITALEASPHEATPASASIPTRTGALRVGVVATTAALAIAAAWVLMARRPAEHASASPAASLEQPTLAASVAATPAPASSMLLTIDSTPPGASVSVGGAARGTTPLSLPLERADGEVQVDLELAGFKHWSTGVSRASDQHLRIALERSAAPQAAPPPVPRKIRRFD